MNDPALWTPEEVQAATGGVFARAPAAPATGASIDSRSLEPGDIFFAIAGPSRDGHDFVPAALDRGAAFAVIARTAAARLGEGAFLLVDDPLAALADLGRAGRRRSAAKVVAVTGSVGKTTTKEALRVALSASGPTHASVASYNNHWGVPLTLARMPRRTAYGVFEIGMNHKGEITPLTALVRPHVAIVTAIAESHLGHFDGLAGIADAKAEIFGGVEPGGAALINGETPFHERLEQAARGHRIGGVYRFGAATDADVRLVEGVFAAEHSDVVASVFGERLALRIGAPGRHMALNALAVLGAVKLCGADLAAAAAALSDFAPGKGRGMRHRLPMGAGAVTLIDESYNANPASMRAALALLAQAEIGPGGRRIAVLGDMLELGDSSNTLHRALAKDMDAAGVDSVYACGSGMSELVPALNDRIVVLHRTQSAELVEPLAKALRAGDVVMVKGSLGSRMGVVVEALKERLTAAGGR
ncbi:MAG: UDP-N-acetylmuramoylalanyl-D-glutamyl-2,6-diaminopimelate--D-alanyl-D-alanine ligase [Aestuariivirgaceae bacterium]